MFPCGVEGHKPPLIIVLAPYSPTETGDTRWEHRIPNLSPAARQRQRDPHHHPHEEPKPLVLFVFTRQTQRELKRSTISARLCWSEDQDGRCVFSVCRDLAFSTCLDLGFLQVSTSVSFRSCLFVLVILGRVTTNLAAGLGCFGCLLCCVERVFRVYFRFKANLRPPF